MCSDLGGCDGASTHLLSIFWQLTTVQDLQQMAKIIVVAKRDEDPDGIELGHFKMVRDGLPRMHILGE
jgi:hypothetical protein